MRDWLATLRDRLREQDSVVRVTVAAVRGSAPRDPGASMLIHAGGEDGTIGGGHLELMASGIARDMLSPAAVEARLDRFPLGASLGQCCGGIVELWFERFTAADIDFLDSALRARSRGGPCLMATSMAPATSARHRLLDGVGKFSDSTQQAWLQREAGQEELLFERLDLRHPPLWLFGAGHVGKAMAKVFADLPVALTWIDSREAMLPAAIPPQVRAIATDAPVDAVADAPAGAMYLVLTHSHDLDFDICRAILARGDFAWAGLIGSATKAARFRQRLAQRGVNVADIDRIICPIGIAGIASKLPQAIAVSVAAQVLQVIEASAAATTTQLSATPS